jgi:hypothetical protein
MKYFSFIFVSLILSSFLQAQDEIDKVLASAKSQFLEDLMSREGFIYTFSGPQNAFLQPSEPILSEKLQVLLKNGKTLKIALGATGKVYDYIGENDSNYLFKKIGGSPNINYNIGAYYFQHKGLLYCFGGYGFWKSHGTLKVFNTKDGEWDIIPLNKEIIPQLFNIGNSWYDDKKERLYVAFQSIINDGISGEQNQKGIIDPDTYVLDLRKNKWKKLGKGTESMLNILQNGVAVANTAHGLLVLESKKLYLVNFDRNEISISKNALMNQTFMRAQEKSYMYHYRDKLYYYKPENGVYDSIKVEPRDFELLKSPIWEKESESYLITAFMLAPFVFLAVFLWNKKTLKTNQISTNTTQKEAFKIEFTDIEKSFLAMLAEKTEQKNYASVADINYNLGLKDKNTGLQKKVRSDTISKINQKYAYLTMAEEPLIIANRSETDKRFYEYSISLEAYQSIKEVLE